MTEPVDLSSRASLPERAANALSAKAIPGSEAAPDPARIRAAAEAFEAVFLAEMLKHAGLGAPREGLGGGGAGEVQAAPFLTRAYAEQLAEQGGIGLADQIARSLAERAQR